MTIQDIAARIVGFIRQAAVGDPLLPYELRVNHAPQKMLASRSWTTLEDILNNLRESIWQSAT